MGRVAGVGGVFEWTRVVAGASSCVVSAALGVYWSQLNLLRACELIESRSDKCLYIEKITNV